MKNCPRCYTSLHKSDHCEECGWIDVTANPALIAERVAADRERMIAGARRRHSGDRACQERYCHILTRALPGKQFCAKHQAQYDLDPDSVELVGKRKTRT